jgi:hypothetical protein
MVKRKINDQNVDIKQKQIKKEGILKNIFSRKEGICRKINKGRAQDNKPKNLRSL